MSQNLGVGLLDLPVICEGIELVALLWRAVLVRAVTGIVVFEKRHGAILPGQLVCCIAHHADPVSEAVQSSVVSAVDRFQAELAREIEDAAGSSEMIWARRCWIRRGCPYLATGS